MIKDENLKQATDYSEGQKTAAYMILGEIVNLLGEFSENLRIIGGWVPTLLYPDSEHIGSIDVDVLLNQLQIRKAESYKTIKHLLEQNGYKRHPEKYFTDGALDRGHVNVISIVPYFVMKASALGRGKPKDAYDIYCVIDNYKGGVKALASEFALYADKKLVQNMCQKLDEKFTSVRHAGPVDVAAFLGITDEEETERIKQDVYQKVHYLVKKIKTDQATYK